MATMSDQVRPALSLPKCLQPVAVGGQLATLCICCVSSAGLHFPSGKPRNFSRSPFSADCAQHQDNETCVAVRQQIQADCRYLKTEKRFRKLRWQSLIAHCGWNRDCAEKRRKNLTNVFTKIGSQHSPSPVGFARLWSDEDHLQPYIAANFCNNPSQ